MTDIEPMRHCRAETAEADDGMSTTCMLAAGHGGQCEPTRDDEITITFAEAAR
jgi:hypothetical protein